MNFGLLFSIAVFALLEVVRAEYVRAYGVEARECLGYVGLVTLTLLLVFVAFPDNN